MRQITLGTNDLTTVKAYVESLNNNLRLLENPAEGPLIQRGVARNALFRHKAGLFDGHAPRCIETIMNRRAFKEPLSCILMLYTLHGIPTHLLVSRSGIFESFPLERSGGIFLEENVKDETLIFVDEVDALIASFKHIPAVCVTEADVMSSYDTKLILVDSPEKPLAIAEALSYYKVQEDVQVTLLTASVADLRRRGLAEECRDNRLGIFEWISKAIVRQYHRSVASLTASLEDCGMADDIREDILCQLVQDDVNPFIIKWFQLLDLSARSVYVNGTRIIQTKGGWRIAGDSRMLSDFQLVVNKTKTIKKIKMAECSITTHDGKEYGFDIPVTKLGTQRSLDIYVHAHLNSLGVGPDIFSNNITIPNVNWMHIAHKFSPYTHVLQDTSSLGFEDFAALYNDIFTYTKFKQPANQHACNHDPSMIGYWHHESGDLYVHRGRLLKSLRELTGKKLTAHELEQCFSDTIGRVKKAGSIYFVFPVHMVDTTPEGVVLFKTA